jgi:hypothetical protein
MEILATGGSDLSCLFLHLRDSPSLPLIYGRNDPHQETSTASSLGTSRRRLLAVR